EYWPISDSVEDESIFPLVVEPSDDPFQSDPWFQIRDIRGDEQHLVFFEEFEVCGPALLEGRLCDVLQLRNSWKAFLLHRSRTVAGQTCLSRGIIDRIAALSE